MENCSIKAKGLEWLIWGEVISIIASVIWGSDGVRCAMLTIMPVIIKITYDKYLLYYMDYEEALKILGVDSLDTHLKVHMAWARRIEEINEYCVYSEKERHELLDKVDEAYECWRRNTDWPQEEQEYLYEILGKYPELYKTNIEYCGIARKNKCSCTHPIKAKWDEAYALLAKLREGEEKALKIDRNASDNQGLK